jgi:multiple sugar transport system ATP-binding protein
VTAVAIEGLHKSFGDTVVLHDVHIDVPEGAFAVLVGPSGCGKSTLLRLIAGLEQADRGAIRFGERDVTRLEPRERDVAMVFQSYALYPHLSVRDNLGFGLKLRKTAVAEIAERVAEASEMLGLGQLLDRMPRELSGGQRQRVAMGRAIVRRPALFLFDEPLSNLDAALRAQVRIDIRRLHDEMATTSVYVTHDQVEAMTLADVMFVLNGGRVEQAGAPLEVYDRPATKFVAGFLGSPSMNFLEGQVTDEGLVRLGDDAALKVSSGRFSLDGARPRVTVGIRPHDVQPATDSDEQAIVMAVTYTEQLGGETYAYGRIDGQDFVARLEPSTSVRPGDRLPLVVDAERVHLFDEAGASLRC